MHGERRRAASVCFATWFVTPSFDSHEVHALW